MHIRASTFKIVHLWLSVPLCISHEGHDEVWEVRQAYPDVHWAFWDTLDCLRGCLWVDLTSHIFSNPSSFPCLDVASICFWWFPCAPVWCSWVWCLFDIYKGASFHSSYRCKNIALESHSFFKVCWRHLPIEEATWETMQEMREQFPGLFEP